MTLFVIISSSVFAIFLIGSMIKEYIEDRKQQRDEYNEYKRHINELKTKAPKECQEKDEE